MPLVFNDPIHGRIGIPDAFRTVVESPVLARLRNIRQLGFTLARYPGAVHTRFEHTLGTVATLIQLMRLLGNQDSQSQDLFVLSALLNEIGIPPLSHSSRPIFSKYGLPISEYAFGLYSNYLRPELGLSTVEEKPLLGGSFSGEPWFNPITQFEEYSYLNPITLSSTIDYVLRDSYYTGRYSGFDYRYFASLLSTNNLSGSKDLKEALRILHRSVQVLNTTYGDPARRVLTILLSRLVDRLVEYKFIDLTFLKEPKFLITYDDDEFLYLISSGVRRATEEGDTVASRIHRAINQRVAPEPRLVSLTSLGVAADEEASSVRHKVAEHLSWPSDLVVLYHTHYDNTIGFRMFGIDFNTYEEAVRSAIFQRLTGLTSNITEAEPSLDEILVYLA
jgi:HD superfamily phosphohydrolase